MKSEHTADTFFGFDQSMKIPLISSGVFHVALFALTIIGMPFVAKEPMTINTPITIELITKAQVTQTPEPAKPAPPAPAKMVEEAPPDLTEPEIEKPKDSPKDVAPPEPIPNPDIKPEPQKKQPKKPDPKVTKVEKKLPPKKDFSSLLKNLTPDLEKPPKPPTENPSDESPEDTSKITQLGDQLTMSETDAVLYQLSQCWNVLSGVRMAENMVIEVHVKINPDRTLNDASVVDRGRYNRDVAFRAAADAALRALRNPRCSPLALPPEKYDLWKTTIINFDPREML